ncbi:hypothetical protein L227DRAFT_583442 [Lentinus tigrinus ALCF2SS1-6]|uniref:Uncharacterized protein n=1 Tax=Lentinus tigrinus ALCF2SS1-6 TaxID=1328759 RepID=A0A5C2SQG3_9APHY|nr:hypothetical protein L227DRAFT_583442 [Lentinus tigrinus ALCF2SS1-6]
MLTLPTLASLLLLAVPRAVYADPCVSFDVDFNLLAFGFNGKDYNAGKQDSWTSGSATDITASGRPPFDGANTTCYLAQFFNAVYVLNGDKANPSDIYIYDAAKKSWSTQKTTTGNFDPSDFKTILDHDTNVFYAISHGEMYSLDMGEKTAAQSDALSWEDVQTTPYGNDYDPVMALAQNHIHFIGVPNVPAGSADIFVIHFSFFQPQSQSYGGATFPASHGETASFFQSEGVQQEFAFIPDDGSMTYVINVENNSTSTLAGPTSKDPKAQYAASITALVQLDSTGAVSFIPYTQGDASTNSAAKWASVAALPAVAPASSGSASATGASATGASAAGTAPAGTRLPASSTASGSGSSSTGGAAAGSNGAFANAANFGGLASALLAALAFLQ